MYIKKESDHQKTILSKPKKERTAEAILSKPKANKAKNNALTQIYYITKGLTLSTDRKEIYS